MAKERLQKVVARAGVASRRAAEELILKGRVRVNGAVVVELGTKVDPRADKVEVDGRRLVAEAPLYILLHKPRGVVSTVHDPEGRPTVRELLPGISERIFPVGRLDYHTSGALLLTNDGEFCDGLIHPKRDVPKTYVLKVQGEMRDADRMAWEEGVVIDGEKTRPAEVFVLRHEQGKTWLEVTLYEGRNQQIRKMGEATGFPVMRLARTSFAGVTTDRLRPGEFRTLTREELGDLRERFGVPRRLPKGGTVGLTNVARGPAPRIRRADSAPAPAPEARPWRDDARADSASDRRGRRDDKRRGVPSSEARRDGRPSFARGPREGARPAPRSGRRDEPVREGGGGGRRDEGAPRFGGARREEARKNFGKGRRDEAGPRFGGGRRDEGAPRFSKGRRDDARGPTSSDRGPRSRGTKSDGPPRGRSDRQKTESKGRSDRGRHTEARSATERRPEANRSRGARGERRLTDNARPFTRKNGG
jgi:23S rRNA pseudouridine2605 synthase